MYIFRNWNWNSIRNELSNLSIYYWKEKLQVGSIKQIKTIVLCNEFVVPLKFIKIKVREGMASCKFSL